jgi:hypothetical protein
MAHHYRVDHETTLESKLILAQLTDSLTGIDIDIARGRLQIAAKYFHKRGFARAVGADQAIAIAVAEFDRNIFKQGFGPELNGNVGSGDQNLRPKNKINKGEKPLILYDFSRNCQCIQRLFPEISLGCT